jgi:hypothetical protein
MTFLSAANEALKTAQKAGMPQFLCLIKTIV